MKTKKIAAVLLTCIVAIGLMAGCGASNTNQSASNNDSQSTSTNQSGNEEADTNSENTTDTTENTSTGNGKQTKPIGLITADEVNMAGGKSGSRNMLYYLYTGTDYWTMSPSYFNVNAPACEFHVTSSGELDAWIVVTFGSGVRPVINLNTENLEFTGTGTMQDPFVIE